MQQDDYIAFILQFSTILSIQEDVYICYMQIVSIYGLYIKSTGLAIFKAVRRGVRIPSWISWGHLYTY